MDRFNPHEDVEHNDPPKTFQDAMAWAADLDMQRMELEAQLTAAEERNAVLDGLLDELENDPDVPMHHRATIDQVRTLQKDGRVISAAEARVKELEIACDWCGGIIAHLREGLEFYADEDNWWHMDGRQRDWYWVFSFCDDDKNPWDIARATLDKIGGE